MSNTNIYLVKTDSLGNSSTPPNGIVEWPNEIKSEINIYPNPFSCEANLTLHGNEALNESAVLVIYDMYGNETTRAAVTSSRAAIGRGNLSTGMYVCKIINKNIIIATGKFIIQ
jgi:hypothetical protein